MKNVLTTLQLKTLKRFLNAPALPGFLSSALFGRRPFGFTGLKGFGRKLGKLAIYRNSLPLRMNYGNRIPIPVHT